MRPVAALAIAGSGLLVGALGAYRPIALGAALLAGLASLPLVRALSGRPLVQVGLVGVLGLHTVNLVRGMWFAKDLWVFDAGRLPATALVAALVLVGAHDRLTRGAGRAAVDAPLVFFAWAGVSGLAGLDPVHSVFHTAWLAAMVVLLGAVLSMYPSPRAFWRAWLRGLVWVGVVALSLSLVAIAVGAEPAAAFRGVGSVQRPGYQGLFFSPNYLGIHACITVGAVLGLAALDGPRRGFYAVLGLCLVASALCASRAALLGTLLGLGTYTVILPGERRRRGLLAGAVLAVFVVLALQTDVARTGFERLAGTGDLVDEGKEPRQIIWAAYARQYVERPVFGVGFQIYGTEGDRAVMRELGRAMTSHSVLIEYGLTTGVPGTLLFLWIVVGIGRGVRTREGRACLPSLAVFWMATAPSYLFDTMGTAPSQPATWPLLAWVLTARAFAGVSHPPAPTAA